MPSQESKSSEAKRQAEIRRAYEEERKKMLAAREQRDRLRVTMFSQKHA